MEMKHYSEERKAAVLRKMLSPDSISVAELAEQEGITRATLYYWRKQAIARGVMSAVSKKGAEEWSAESRLAAVIGTALLSEVELSEYCREKGLYPDQIKAWKQACIAGQQTASQQKQAESAQARADQKRIRELERELQRKEKALAEAAALLILRKKLNALWGSDTEED